MFENISENRNVVLGIKLNKFEVNYLMDLLYFYKLTDKLTIVDLNNSNRLISRLCLLYGLESSIGSMELLKYQPFSEDVEEVNYSTQVVESLGGVTSVLIFNEDKGITEGTEPPTEKGAEKPTENVTEPRKSEDLGGKENAKNEG